MTPIESGVMIALSLVNSFRILAYVPQLLRIARDRSGVAGVACSTWLMFFASHLTTVVYAIVIARDVTMAVVFIGNATACAAVVGLTIWQRHRLVRSTAGHDDPNPTSVQRPSRCAE